MVHKLKIGNQINFKTLKSNQNVKKRNIQIIKFKKLNLIKHN